MGQPVRAHPVNLVVQTCYKSCADLLQVCCRFVISCAFLRVYDRYEFAKRDVFTSADDVICPRDVTDNVIVGTLCIRFMGGGLPTLLCGCSHIAFPMAFTMASRL